MSRVSQSAYVDEICNEAKECELKVMDILGRIKEEWSAASKEAQRLSDRIVDLERKHKLECDVYREKLTLCDRQLRKWEAIAERDHGKRPGSFRAVVKELEDPWPPGESLTEIYARMSEEDDYEEILLRQLEAHDENGRIFAQAFMDNITKECLGGLSTEVGECRLEGCTNAGRYDSGYCGIHDILHNNGEGEVC